MTYNLLVEPWIPALWMDGKFSRVGIRQALIHAGRIRQIAASNPMDNVALLRFLLAVFLWCKPNMREEERVQLAGAQGIPDEWLREKLSPDGRPSELFDLLGDGVRFYQDAQLSPSVQRGKGLRPVGDLLAEFPGADSVNHMRHVLHDGSYGLCPACCALGILRLSVWAPANRFYPSSVNPASAAYSVVDGKSLLATLFSNLPVGEGQTNQAPWQSDSPPPTPDVVACLAWRPRKLWLDVGNRAGSCAYCGRVGPLVTHLFSEAGWPTPVTGGQKFSKEVETEFRKFGHLPRGTDRNSKLAKRIVKSAPLILQCRMDELREAYARTEPVITEEPATETEAQGVARMSAGLIKKGMEREIKKLTRKATEEEQEKLGPGDAKMKRFWAADPHLLKDSEPISLPALEANVAAHSSKFWRDAFRLRHGRGGTVTATGPVVNKFTFQDAVSVSLPEASPQRLAEISGECRAKLEDMLKRVTPNPELKHPEVSSAFVLLVPDVEARIRRKLGETPPSVSGTENDEKHFLRNAFAPMVKLVVASTIPGSPLRRREAEHRARQGLGNQIDKVISESNRAETSTGAMKKKRGRRKRGGE